MLRTAQVGCPQFPPRRLCRRKHKQSVTASACIAPPLLSTRGNPHERLDFAWTQGSLTGKSSAVVMSAASKADSIEKPGELQANDRWPGCVAPVSTIPRHG
jgi:hypothetical protein